MAGGSSPTLAHALLRALPRRQLGLGAASAFAVVPLLDRTAAAGSSMSLQAGALMLSLALALPVVAIAWAALVWIGSEGPSGSGALTLQFAALVFVTLAVAAALPSGSQLAGPLVALTFLTALVAASASTAVHWALVPHPGDGRWVATWAALAVTAALALLLASRDPAQRPRRRASTAR